MYSLSYAYSWDLFWDWDRAAVARESIYSTLLAFRPEYSEQAYLVGLSCCGSSFNLFLAASQVFI